jgi:hypothetical protein
MIALERTGTEPFNLENIAKDIITEFGFITEIQMIKAIRNGSLGKYGRTFKFSSQEVCIWIREYLKTDYDNRVNWHGLLEMFNKLTKTNFVIITETTKKQISDRIKEGYTMEQIWLACKNCAKDQNAINFNNVNLDFITRSENMNKYQSKPQSKQQDRL